MHASSSGGVALGLVAPACAATTASFSVTPSQATSGQPVTFDPTGSTGTGLVFRWDFDGDGLADATSSSSRPVVSFSYALPGTYTAILTVTASDRTSATTTQSVTIANQPPTEPVFQLTATPVLPVGASVKAYIREATDPEGHLVKCEWDFDGDGIFETPGSCERGSALVSPSAEHTYTSAGTYVVSLRVSDDAGGSAISSQNLVVEPPVAPATGHPAGTP